MSDVIAARRMSRFSVPRGLITGTLAAIGVVWALYVITGGSLLSAQVQTGIYLGLLLLTTFSRRAKVLIFQTLQRFTLNPLIRLLLAMARQRKIIAWHPLRTLNAMNVRVFGADLLTVHVQLNMAGVG
jgi:hypothetical protein